MPFSWIYYLITQVRNVLYDRGIKPSVEFEVPVICVGNLAVGGTGKTPMIEHLIRLLRVDHKIATLSRGYGRNTKGFRIAGPDDSAATLGDEPFQFYQKFANNVTVAVGEERALAIPNILQEKENTKVILLDDGFQHRRVRPGFSILLSDYNRPFYNDLLLPAGRLRESRWGAQRAHVIVITKCPPTLSEDKMITIEKSVRSYSDAPVFFAAVRYGNPVPLFETTRSLSKEVVLISGIANAKPLEEYVAGNYSLIDHMNFRDHHQYSQADVQSVAARARNNRALSFITTEKDSVKLKAPEFKGILANVPLFVLPIEIDFIKGGKDFDEMILNAVNGKN